MRAGAAYGIVPAGVAAMDVLDLEAGVPRPELDYKPARAASDAEPMPAALGLELLDRRRASRLQRQARVSRGETFAQARGSRNRLR